MGSASVVVEEEEGAFGSEVLEVAAEEAEAEVEAESEVRGVRRRWGSTTSALHITCAAGRSLLSFVGCTSLCVCAVVGRSEEAEAEAEAEAEVEVVSSLTSHRLRAAEPVLRRRSGEVVVVSGCREEEAEGRV
jgi:hypothetical protein